MKRKTSKLKATGRKANYERVLATSAPKPPVAPSLFLVEDDSVVRMLLEHLFRRRGFTVYCATDGQQALSLISELPAPDSILLDVLLPHVDGLELLKHIRRHETWRGVPIVMLTSKAHEKDITRAFEYGADDYITKPFRAEEVIVRVKRLLKK